MQTMQDVFGGDYEVWRETFVDQSVLESGHSYTVNNAILCAILASRLEEGYLFCMAENQCTVYNLKTLSGISEDGMNDPIRCLTKLNTNEEVCTAGVPFCSIEYSTKSATEMPWPEAREYCQSLGMDLLTRPYLETAAQCAQILDTLQIASKYWIGAYNSDIILNTFEWIDGTTLDGNDPRWMPLTPEYGEEYVVINLDYTFDDFPAFLSAIAVCGYRI